MTSDGDRPKPQYDHLPREETAGFARDPSKPPVDPSNEPSLANWQPMDEAFSAAARHNVALPCGWGRLIFGHTFSDSDELARVLCEERPGQRDIALYIRDPHVVLSKAPHELFLDPSHTFRLPLDKRPEPGDSKAVRVRRLDREEDAVAINTLFACHHMAPIDPVFVWRQRDSAQIVYLVAEDVETGAVVGCVTGVDHVAAFNDPEGGSSLWTLAVHPDARHPGIGKALALTLAEHFAGLGRSFMDLSVLAENENAIRLYEKLGFHRVPVFCIKHKHNPINEDLYVAPDQRLAMNPYATIITDEARKRGISLEVLDAERGYFKLIFGGRTVTCRESLTTLTSAIAMSRCADKRLTCEILGQAGLRVPESRFAGDDTDADREFLARHGSVVVKPLIGEQGQGIAVDIADEDEVRIAIARARQVCSDVLLEQYVEGHDLRIVVIGDEVVAAALRRPPVIVGNGKNTIRELVEKLSRRRSAATGGESSIPLDEETERAVTRAGHSWHTVLPEGEHLAVRKTANLHTGGSLEDVTDEIHPVLAEAAVRAAQAIEIPVTGLDFLVPYHRGEDYVIIEANERPGLANHEPQPTAEKFLDLLFPRSARKH
jgi:GNAT-family acetyltransferase (TIGR03103 family)